MTRIFFILSAGFAVFLSANLVAAVEWGDVQLRFVFEGNPPPSTEFQLGGQKVIDESLLDEGFITRKTDNFEALTKSLAHLLIS